MKLYVLEPDSERFQSLTKDGVPLVTGRIAIFEAYSVFRRREAEGLLRPGQATAIFQELAIDIEAGRIVVQEHAVDAESQFKIVLEKCLSCAPPVFVRTNDALHIASALLAGETEFVTADVRQRQAAMLLGLSIPA